MTVLEQPRITTMVSKPGSKPANSDGDMLGKLLNRIRSEPEYPAVAEHISEITQKTAPENPADTNDLSTAILNDYALTTKLLRMVNSASFSQYGGQISTVSRAIVILGFEQVRAAALSILLMDHLSSTEQADSLKDATCTAFMSGVIAKQMARDYQLDPEQAFITSLFHKLGKQLSIYYFPDEHRKIDILLNNTETTETAACRKELGVTYTEIGIAIAREWRLPESIIIGMRSPKVSKNKITPDILNAHLAICANEIAVVAGQQGDLKSKDLKKITDRYKYIFNQDPDQLCELVEQAVPELRAYSEILQSNMTSSNYYKKLTNSESLDQIPTVHEDIDTPTSNETDPEMLSNAFNEISNTMQGDYQLNEVINMIMETIYRGMSFERVLFCLRDTQKNLMVARFGLGQDIDDIIPQFRYPITKGEDLFNLAVSRQRNFVIIDSSSEKYKGQVPVWCKNLTSPHSLIVFPVVVNKKCIGLLYADTQNVDTTFSVDVIKMFGDLRNQAALAIQQKRVGK